MSTSEEIPLQAVDSEKVEDGKDLESQETSPSTKASKGTAAPSGWSWKKIFTTVTTLIAYAFMNAGISVVAPFYPIVAEKYNVPVYYTGFVLGMAPLVVTLTSSPIGYFLPHLGLKFTQLAGLFLAGGSLILFGFVASMPTATLFLAFSFLLRIVSGVGIAMSSTASYTLLTQFYVTKKGTIVSLMELSLIIGFAMGPALGGGLQMVGGFMLPFVVVGGFNIALMLLLIAIMPSTECTSVQVSWRILLKLFSNIMFILIVLVLVLVIGTFGAALAYFGRFLHFQFKLSLAIIGGIYSGLTLTDAVVTTIVGPLTDKLKRPRCFIICGLVIGGIGFQFIGPAGFITTPLIPGCGEGLGMGLRVSQLEKLWLTIIACLVIGAGSGLAMVPVYPELHAIAKTIYQDETAITSLLSGLLVAVISAGEAIGPMIGGGLVYKVGFQTMTAILGLTLLVFAMVLIVATVIEKLWRSAKCQKFMKSNEQ